MKNLFNSVQLTKPNSNFFDLTHDVKLSFNMGELVPVCLMECVPGDRIKISGETLLRFSPLVSPVMHRMDMFIHYFFVPNRIIWDEWEEFITNSIGRDDIVPVMPQVEWGATPAGTDRLGNYLGLPFIDVDSTNFNNVSALPFWAYQKIYDEYYRDQNLIPSVYEEVASGQVYSPSDVNAWWALLKKRAWEHDYFTSALPFAQKGPAVDIPLGKVKLTSTTGVEGKFRHATNHAINAVTGGAFFQTSNTGVLTETSSAGAGLVYDPLGTLEVDSTTINDLRRAYALQAWFERSAVGGTRYIEQIRAMFGVNSSDKRLQRPEYITGVKSPVQISEVLNTTGPTGATDEAGPQGNMAGHGISVAQGRWGNYFCEEHGYVIGIMSVMPKTAYYQGIPRHWSKITDFTDFYWEQFAHLGEQEVLNKEIYADQILSGAEGTFGYVPRYSEYKFMPSRVAGDFATSKLDFWHLGRKFDAPPALNEDFINCVPKTDIFAVEDPTVQKMYCHVLNKVGMSRLMPIFGTPSTI